LVSIPEALATTQFSDILYLNGQKHSLDSLPLEPYYGPGNPRPKFRAPNTATWRGYIATWEIDRGVLYLKTIQAWTDQANRAPGPVSWPERPVPNRLTGIRFYAWLSNRFHPFMGNT
jgi:hypothetical protein